MGLQRASAPTDKLKCRRLGQHKNGRTVVPAIFHFDGQVLLHPSISQSKNISQNAYRPFNIGGLGWFDLPNFKDVAATVPLPNFIFAGSPHDGMTSSYLRAPFPWVTKCQIEGQENSLMLPIKLNSTRYIGDADHPRAGPGDPRDKRAVFLGSDTGELLGRCAQTGRGAQGVQGYKLRECARAMIFREEPAVSLCLGRGSTGLVNYRRRAVVRLGRKRSNELYAKFTSFAQGSEDWHVYANDTGPRMSMKEQIGNFSKIIYVGGNCASLRMDNLLNSDALTMFVLESLPLWYFPLLVPYKHFVPIIYEPGVFTEEEGLNWDRAWHWAHEQPEAVAEVVREANKFAQLHLSKKGKTCYMARAMMHYAKLMTDRSNVKHLWEQSVEEFPFEGQYSHLTANSP
eukprot:jgi/Astpho2/2354/Aster-05618